MQNPLFNILGLLFIGSVAVTGLQSIAERQDQQMQQVFTCLDQVNSQYSTCGR